MTNTTNNNNHHHHHHGHNKIVHHHHHLLTPHSSTTTRSNSTTQACAACRYQRRKCAPDCILAPYFPHDRQKQFQNAHKLFGVSNITKIIRDLDPPQKDEAMRTIIFQSDIRAQDPVGGCYRYIKDLQRQIDLSRAELEIVLHQLAIYRAHAVQNQTQNHQIMIDEVDCEIHLVNNPDDPNLYDDPSAVLDTANNEHLHHHQNQNHNLDLHLDHIPQQQHHHEMDHHHVHGHQHEHYILGQQDLNNQDDGCDDDHVVPLQEINSWAAMHNSPPSSSNCLEIKQQPVKTLADECEDFKPLTLNDIPTAERHEFKFEFEETNEPSEGTLFNEANHKGLIIKEENNVSSYFTKEEENASYQQQQNEEDHDLKGAATLFTLTNCTSY